jgi:hypothetical protein
MVLEITMSSMSEQEIGIGFKAAAFLISRIKNIRAQHLVINGHTEEQLGHMLLLSSACYYGNIGVVKALLNHPDIDSSARSQENYEDHFEDLENNNESLHVAAQAGNYEIITMLLSSAKFKVTKYDYHAFFKNMRGAMDSFSQKGTALNHLQCLKVLLQDSRLIFEVSTLLIYTTTTLKFEQGVSFLLEQEKYHNNEEISRVIEHLLRNPNGAASYKVLNNFKETPFYVQGPRRSGRLTGN